MCFNGVNMPRDTEYHQPLAFIKSHQGTNKSVCTLIKHEKKDNFVSAVLGNINGLPRELEFAIKLIPFLPLNGRHHPQCTAAHAELAPLQKKSQLAVTRKYYLHCRISETGLW